MHTKPPVRPKLDPFITIIDEILADDKSRPKKQQHTSKRIFERLRDDHGFTGGITIVKDYVAGWRQRAREMFVPLMHPPGHAQADFVEDRLRDAAEQRERLHVTITERLCRLGRVRHHEDGVRVTDLARTRPSAEQIVERRSCAGTVLKAGTV